MWVSKVSFLSINTSKHLLEVTYETILLSMDMALGKSLDLLFKLYVDPMSIKLVFKRVHFEPINCEPITKVF